MPCSIDTGVNKLIDHLPLDIQMHGLNIHVPSGVFNPDAKGTNSSSQVIKHMGDVGNLKVLDMGCGTGVLGMVALARGATQAVFADNSLLAQKAVEINLRANDLQSKGSFVQSDLFQNIDHEFDLILANLPILNELWSADQSNGTYDLVYTFLEQFTGYLNENGRVLLTWASFEPLQPVVQKLQSLGYTYDLKTETKLGIQWHLIEISL